MAFLFQDQNQGIRNDAPRGLRLSRPFSFIRTLTVGFGITPNLLTLFPQGEKIPQREKKALAGLGFLAFTAGGDFHPALRTSAARLGGLTRIWPMAAIPASGLAVSGHGESACPHDAKARPRARRRHMRELKN
jgi:hypothetical protein